MKLLYLTLLVSSIFCQSQNLDELRTKLLTGINNVDKRGTPGILRVYGKNAVSLMIGNNTFDTVGAALIYGENQGRVCAFSHNSYVSTNNFPLILNCARWMQEKKGLNTYMSLGINDDSYLSKNGFVKIQGSIFSSTVSLDNVGLLLINLNAMPNIQFNDANFLKIVNFLKNGGGLICGATSWAAGEEREFSGNYILSDQGLFFSNQYFNDGVVKVNTQEIKITNILYASYDILSKAQTGDLRTQATVFINFSNQFTYFLSQLKIFFTAAKYSGNYESVNSLEIELFAVLNQIYKTACLAEILKPPISNLFAKACVNLVIANNHFNGLSKVNNPQIISGEIFPGKTNQGKNWETLGKQIYQGYVIDAKRNRWTSTGLYALPGASIQIILPAGTNLKNISVRIGSHTDNISHHEKWARFPTISNVYYFFSNSIKFTTYDGGLVYFDIKEAPSSFVADIYGEIVRAPYFNIEKTLLSDWNSFIKYYPAPWAEIEGQHFISTVQSSHVRSINNPDLIATFYGSTLMNSYYDFTSTQIRTYKERWVCDIDIGAGYMHSGYPIMSFLDQNDAMLSVPAPVNEEKYFPIDNGLWGQYHEIGHNYQNSYWTFSGEGEVTNNWLSAYHEEYFPGRCQTNFCAFDLRPSGNSYKNIIAYQLNPDFEKWKSDPFLALSMYLELRLAFGWQAFKDLIKQFAQAPSNELPQNDDQKRDQKMVRFSRIVNRNLAPFFIKWGVPTSQEAKNSISNLLAWDTSFIVDCSKRWGPKAPCAQMSLSNTNYGEISTYTLTLNTWNALRFKAKDSLIITFKGDIPTHPSGKTQDIAFPIILDLNSQAYFGQTAVYNATNNSLQFNVIKYLPLETDLKISFTFKNCANYRVGYVTASLKIHDQLGTLINYIERDLEFSTKLGAVSYLDEENFLS